MVTKEQFFRNLSVHVRFAPFDMLVGLFLGLAAMNAVTGHPVQAAAWILCFVAMVCIAGFLGDDDDDPQHPVPGWDPQHRPTRPVWCQSGPRLTS